MSEKIRLSGVPETMLQTVYARAKESKGRGAIHDGKAEEIIGKLAYLAGQNPGGGPRTPEALAEDFHWDAVPRRDIPLPEGLF